MGSVKDLEVLEKPTKTTTGIGRFHFSDRYSVFDWGEMPDLINGKGEALCLMGAYYFEKLEEQGVKTHYRGLIAENGDLADFDMLEEPTSTMEISLVNVLKPEAYAKRGRIHYDYSVYTPELKNFLIPLEIIYRNALPEGSSVFRRLEHGKLTLKDLNLDHYPQPGERLGSPFFDFSTKLEERDRYLKWNDAQKIAGLADTEMTKVKELLSTVDRTITELAAKAGLANDDGKIELALDPDRKLMIVDVVGTLDECRFTYKGLHVSKEVARQFYRKTDWYGDVETAKMTAESLGRQDWQSLCKSQPPPLDLELKKIISQMYTSTANELIGKKMFDAPSLRQVLEKYRKYRTEP